MIFQNITSMTQICIFAAKIIQVENYKYTPTMDSCHLIHYFIRSHIQFVFTISFSDTANLSFL